METNIMIIYGKSVLFPLLFFFMTTFPNYADFSSYPSDENIKYNLVHTWAEQLGMELWHLGDFVTRRKEVQESFKQAQVVPRVGQKIVENMANDIKFMMDLKISAVRRIMDTAENTAMSHQNEEADKYFQYYNAKEMLEPHEPEPTEPPRDSEDVGVPKIKVPPKRIVLTKKPEFYNTPVNTSVSAVHVPTNVFDRAEEVIKAIKWSENLDHTFKNNYRTDSTLSWQFFGSATGFMRQFPASKWKQDPVDLYDCRLRSWFIEAATSPKDIVILVDNSGSMTGQGGDVAKHVVTTILDTLGTNDFVNVFTFAEEVVPVVPCFRDILVQANLGNVRELKLGLDQIETEDIANFTAALTKAFEVLEMYRTDFVGARCNQAIMLISDGAPYKYEDIFKEYNEQKQVRVFTYLIGKEVTDVTEIKWMACDNQGYYVHLSDTAEVREEVLNYIPVMARPLVLGRHDHPVIWTQIYADVVDPKMTDWLWEEKECDEQKELFLSERENRELFHSAEMQSKRWMMKQKRNFQQSSSSPNYQFMTTVAMPVYDRRENANITEDVLVNEAYWVTVTRETRIANLLGVAGTDIPINDIKKLLMPFMLGVNGYAFIVTNNGYILVHPDFRPLFQDILKPAYNSVDMIEVELLDDDRLPRDFNPVLLTVRDQIINQSAGSKWMLVKYHFDDMKRVSRMRRQYFWTGIQNTPFTLVVTYPELYGVNRIQIRSEDEIHRMHVKGSNVVNFFNGHWMIHPDWLYCKHSNRSFSSPEAELLYFLERMKAPGWKWPLNRTPPPPEHAAMYCDRNLMQALVFDARVTEWFSKNTSSSAKDDKEGNELKQRFGITVAFLATHSGLTRWQEFSSNSGEESRTEQEFSENNRRAIDEIWYKRAVEQHFEEAESFVYSVPFENGEPPNETLVTASHAIFHSEGGKSAPVAVVGFQFQHSALYTFFKNITSNGANNSKTCASDGIDCYVLDNSGYVLVSNVLSDTGRFFGEVSGSIMRRLVEERVYKEVIIYDYQAVCFNNKSQENSASFLEPILRRLLNILKLLLQPLTVLFVQIQSAIGMPFEYFDDYNLTDRYLPPLKGKHQEFDERVLINRTRPQSCDQEITLYTLHEGKDKVVFKTPASGCERPFVVMPIPASNLILLVVDTLCPPDPSVVLTPMPESVDYNSSSLPCYKTRFNDFPRIRPISCINKHTNESSIELCGNACGIVANLIIILFTLCLLKIL